MIIFYKDNKVLDIYPNYGWSYKYYSELINRQVELNRYWGTNIGVSRLVSY